MKPAGAILLLDVGNTHLHAGIGDGRRVTATRDLPTSDLLAGRAGDLLGAWLGRRRFAGAALASVVPAATPLARALAVAATGTEPLHLTPATLRVIGMRYPAPETVGQDRLANAIAARALLGAPAVAVGFGTATILDVVDARGDFVGGVIAPGLAAFTDYLHEKTAQLPAIRAREPRRVIGRSTREAMLSGAVTGYRGLVRELLDGIRRELGARRLPVVATGSYAALATRGIPAVTRIHPALALEGLRRLWLAHHA